METAAGAGGQEKRVLVFHFFPDERERVRKEGDKDGGGDEVKVGEYEGSPGGERIKRRDATKSACRCT
jgi:hypothetical protein